MKKAEKKAILIQFIKDNNIRFIEGERNQDSTTMSGFALHLKLKNTSLIKEVVESECSSRDYGWESELDRVFKFAQDNNYGHWWTTQDARDSYEFSV